MGKSESSRAFAAAWKATGRRYGRDALEQVRMGWDLRDTEVDELRAQLLAFRVAFREFIDAETALQKILSAGPATGSEIVECEERLDYAIAVLGQLVSVEDSVSSQDE